MPRDQTIHGTLLLAALLLFAPRNTVAQQDGEVPRNVSRRSDFRNSRLKFEREGRGRIAFLGGSITEMDGYRPMVMHALRLRFPDADLESINAGIASTCSRTGAFRLKRDVLAAGPIDLLFVEFAVNDDQDAGHARRECVRGMEGILRQVRQQSPHTEIIVTYFVNPAMLDTLRRGETPLPIAAHEDVARYYDVSTVNLAAEVAERIDAGELTWEDYGGTHPAPAGNRIAADMIAAMLDAAWRDPLPADAQFRTRPLPEKPLDAGSYFRGRFLPRAQVRLGEGWRIETPDWTALPGVCRTRFADLELICADAPGSVLTVQFEGTAVGAYLLAGPDAGVLEVQVDDGDWRSVNLYHRFSTQLHYPRTVMLATDLAHGPHRLHVRIAEATDARSRGHAARLIDFVVSRSRCTSPAKPFFKPPVESAPRPQQLPSPTPDL